MMACGERRATEARFALINVVLDRLRAWGVVILEGAWLYCSVRGYTVVGVVIVPCSDSH